MFREMNSNTHNGRIKGIYKYEVSKVCVYLYSNYSPLVLHMYTLLACSEVAYTETSCKKC